jgi:NAD(P)-dependent dehydrogenase (short-subunit alcohol dehydrogenase family)
MAKTILTTGASSGFGAMSARALADAGHTVYAGMRDVTARNARAAADAAVYAHDYDVDLRTVELDVGHQRSFDHAVRRVLDEQPALDVVVPATRRSRTGRAACADRSQPS